MKRDLWCVKWKGFGYDWSIAMLGWSGFSSSSETVELGFSNAKAKIQLNSMAARSLLQCKPWCVLQMKIIFKVSHKDGTLGKKIWRWERGKKLGWLLQNKTNFLICMLKLDFLKSPSLLLGFRASEIALPKKKNSELDLWASLALSLTLQQWTCSFWIHFHY